MYGQKKVTVTKLEVPSKVSNLYKQLNVYLFPK